MASSASSSSSGNTGKKRGRPKRGTTVVGPEQLALISELWLTGHNETEIGRQIGVTVSTVRHHMETTIRPLWEQDVTHRKSVELAKIDAIEREAWREFRKSSDPQTRKSIKRQLIDRLAGKVEMAVVERVCAKITTKASPTWLSVIQWCVEQRCQILGYYAPKEHRIHGEEEIRVAGLSRTQLDQSMVARLFEKIAERQKYQVLLDTAGRN